jgi:uncharacterized protein YcfJ
MKKVAVAVASVFTVIAPLAHAAYDQYGNYYEPRTYSAPRAYSPREQQEFARVIESRPVYEAANTKEECWNPRAGHFEERRDSHSSHNKTGTVAGAVVGGVVGHQFDNGSAGATLGGALIGGLLGNQVDKSRNNDRQDDLDYSRCRVVSEGGRNLQGYDVRYRYRGQEYTTRMAQAPGNRLRVGEDIRDDGLPLDGNYSNASNWR